MEIKEKMLESKFGIEIEMTGIKREDAADIVSEVVGGSPRYVGGQYEEWQITQRDGRKWKLVYDGSIYKRERVGNNLISTSRSNYAVELVSPILTYREDMEKLQELVRALRKAGAVSSGELQCGIHIHLDGAPHTPTSIKNFINIIASKNDLLYKALEIKPDRIKWCQKIDKRLVDTIKRRKPKTIEGIKRIWYEGYVQSQSLHYHKSRYHFLNLHSYFQGNHTIELRGFNGELHAGKIRAYVVMALALNYQALTQKKASSIKPQTENEKFAMRTYLNRIGLIGDEFKACRKHLYKHLDGVAAWRYGYPVETSEGVK